MLKPLFHRKRGWGEGTGAKRFAMSGCTSPSVAQRRPYPHPPLRGTFSRWEKGNAIYVLIA